MQKLFADKVQALENSLNVERDGLATSEVNRLNLQSEKGKLDVDYDVLKNQIGLARNMLYWKPL